jgi:SAM-dependent methyltransferase
MRTQITERNPFTCGRYAFAWEYVLSGSAAHLDFGCNDGAFLNTLESKGIGRLVGLDISQEAVTKAHCKFPQLEVIRILKAAPLPFEDNLFDSITLLDVIEHVYEQSDLLDELRRVLKDDGTLIITVPGRHVFSFLDVGNLKFRFPKLHRWYHCRKCSAAEYEHRFVSNPEGLVGDISAKKRWHEHFSREKLAKLLNHSGFEIVYCDGSGFFKRVLTCAAFFCKRSGLLHRLIHNLDVIDAKRFGSANLFCLARKIELKATR